VLLIQQVGLLAALNNIKALAMDARIPTCMLVGYFGRDISRTARDNVARGVHLVEPTLDAWQIPYFPLESPADVPGIRQAYETSLANQGPAVILVGAPTN
jgi:sulfopyruvate decarboxylase subunit alpha